MVSKDEYNKAIEIAKKYEEEQLELERALLREKGTTIPEDKWGVHRTA